MFLKIYPHLYLITNLLVLVLIIAHAGVIKHLLARILNMPNPGTHHMSCFDVPYAGLIKIEICYDGQGNTWPKVIF